ncbi:formate dehydrogenase accessory sulfurtransferase FdhD [Paracoccus sp. R12_1]|jgi:FdhD protein|uniref:formate dehydrogenase accessory sulfurtransferase FdhD n=1 Tax=unclassified Paracoccus (in: a-proteobacteria) TaxID=2688777 RepID=UPI001ADA0B27|nr:MULTISPECIES: formate dehydrogenase accessory sulfurtransferase FdhD [unclassified Paracoccus (in: a-proteobacteria)]MBO9455983.1 formate dehydrogenase accessory sulfurtransferase FdhD [Paracoccus sp. R12_2]MBO9486601.1 formate dehydrogenase accessory sulfurtransferase FdhD [Paracoccus sp. R12_1]
MTLPDPLAVARATHVRPGSRQSVRRTLPEETPVAMVYDGTTLAVMMATPADIDDFAVGFSLTEGVVTGRGQIASCDIVSHDQGIEARMWLTEDRAEALSARRRTLAGPVGCGLCGIDSLAEAARSLPDLHGHGPVLGIDEIAGATESLRDWQPLHDQSHAVHAAGFLLPGRGVVLAREDVGRHNALDKLIGAMARQGLDAGQGAFVLTSRVSVEMVQKCAMAGGAILIAVSAPTAHALRLADGGGITVAAFARGEGFDLFCHPERLKAEVSDVA